MTPLRILIAEDDPSTLMTLSLYFQKQPLFEFVGDARDGDTAIRKTLELKPDVLLCDISMPRYDGIQVTDIVTEELPDLIVVILSAQDTNEYAQLAIEAGAKDYIHKSVDFAAVPSRVHEIVLRVRRIAHSARERERESASKVFAFWGPSGGTGSSTLAINTALELARNQQTVALIDLNLQFGVCEHKLGLTHRNNISTLVDSQGGLMDYKLPSMVETHKSGLKVMYQNDLRESETITGRTVEELLTHAHDQMGVDFVVVDCDTHIDERTLAALDFAHTLFVCVSENQLPVKQCVRALEVFGQLGYADKIKLLVNRAGQRTPEWMSKLPPRFAAFPVDPELFSSAEKSGFLPIIENPSAPFSRAITELVASAILLKKPAQERKPGMVHQLFKKLFS